MIKIEFAVDIISILDDYYRMLVEQMAASQGEAYEHAYAERNGKLGYVAFQSKRVNSRLKAGGFGPDRRFLE
jgi:hypothetical protein